MSEQPPRDDLLERLRRVESGSPRGEFTTNWHRNPDGPEAADRIDRLRAACSRQNAEICQVLGKALGYPWFKDDPVNFPDATEEHGVCVGDHVAESLADEAADRIERLRERVAELEAAKWEVRHIDTMNDLAAMGVAKDVAEARALTAEAEVARLTAEREKDREALRLFVTYDQNDDASGTGMMLAYDEAITAARARLEDTHD